MTNKEKAEAYVRSQIKELMELSFGCEIEIRLLPNPDKTIHKLVNDFTGAYKKNGLPTASSFFEVNEFGGLSGDCMTKIIGHPIQLQHWIGVMRPYFNFDRYYLRLDGKIMFKDNGVDFEKFRFNLTTGQPDTEQDYEALCNIFGI